jgi:hypothetical protein
MAQIIGYLAAACQLLLLFAASALTKNDPFILIRNGPQDAQLISGRF